MKLLTRPGDLVLDLFAGSNMAGEAAESLGRRWLLYPLCPVPCALSWLRLPLHGRLAGWRGRRKRGPLDSCAGRIIVRRGLTQFVE
ncbi:MAG TPA: DNA methyltransferase [Pirellulales bacterium]|nr:DNA methyltransferase [Pirellulales bacterium]